jgi:hypothetical protein
MYWIIASFSSIFFVAWYFYPKKKIVRLIPYENKYMLNAIVDETEELKLLNVVEEVTPEGKVRMKWEDKFVYWADRPIQYKYLETVARKYVLVYKCKENYINIFAELAKAYTKEVVDVKQNEVFATFKSYNTIKRKMQKKCVINENSNQYKWNGKISEFDKPPVPEIKKISYEDYKKNMQV